MGPSMAPDIEGRARAAIEQDGLTELFLGIGLLVFSGFLVLQLFDEVRIYALPWFVLLVMSGVLAAVRRKVTYPRVGYAKFRPSAVKLAMLGLLLVVLVVGITAFMVSLRTGHRWPAGFWTGLVFGIGLGGAGAAALTGWRLGIRRYYLYAASETLAIVLPWAAGIDVRVRAILMMAVPAVALIPGGAVTFRRFLRRNPLPEQEVGDEE
ncbi:MAG: hypothetical protein JSU73_04125 [candidate division WOR-3 bacterium]|nr:MAG: hypothetical protein JSU73_04125 [candidate division WOR-3 bacterium]